MSRPSERGLSLVEVVVALAIAGFLLLSGLAVYAAESGTRRRLAAHAAAERALGLAWESLRAAHTLPVSGPLPIPVEAEQGMLRVVVEPTDDPALFRVQLIATYRATGAPFQRSLVGLLYVP